MSLKAYVEMATEATDRLLSDPNFKALCEFAGVQVTRRQARKYNRWEGRAYAALLAFKQQKP